MRLARRAAVLLAGCLAGRAEHRSYRCPGVAFRAGGMHGGDKVALAAGETGECPGDIPQRGGVLRVAFSGLVVLEPARQLVSVSKDLLS